MKMDLQKFAEEGKQGNQGNEGQEQPTQQPNGNDEQGNKGSSDKLNEKLSNAINQFQGMNKKMTDFFKNQHNSNESSPEKKPTEKPKETEQKPQGEQNSGYEERIANLEKQLQDQQNKSNQNDLAKYTQKKIKDAGLNVDDDTFQHLQGQTQDAIDKNIEWYQGLAKKFNKPSKPAPKSFNNNNNSNNSNNNNPAGNVPKPKSFENGIGKFLK